MKICLLTEGSYPYVLGGVSSWINTMIRSFPEHKFIVFSISCDSKKKGQYKYEIPENVEKIVDIFLDEIDVDDSVSGKNYKLNSDVKKAFTSLLSSNNVKWNELFDFFNSHKMNNVGEFFMSKDFFSIVYDMYKIEYQYSPFTEFLWNIRSMYLNLFYLLSQEIPEADVYHSICTGYAGVIGSYASYLYNKPFILSEHGIYTREREEEIIKSTWIKDYHKEIWKRFFLSLSNCAYEYSSIVTSLFKQNKKIQVELGCNEEKIIIIPNGVDVKSFENLPCKESDDVINIGAIVRIVPIKDIKTMILSFKNVKDSIKNAKFYIMGPSDEDEDYYKECIDLINEIGVKDVVFTGTVNVKEYINKMDIIVLTSISEGQPLAVMESMAAKKPNVCTNVGHCRGLLLGDGDNFGENGFIEFVTDYEGIADSIIRLCKDENLRKKMGENGYNRILNLYTKDKMIDSYKKLYDKCKEGIFTWQE